MSEINPKLIKSVVSDKSVKPANVAIMNVPINKKLRMMQELVTNLQFYGESDS